MSAVKKKEHDGIEKNTKRKFIINMINTIAKWVAVVLILIFISCLTFCPRSPLNKIVDSYSSSMQDCPNEKMNMSEEGDNELSSWVLVYETKSYLAP